MSIADKLTQLTDIRGDIRSALVAKGVSASDHNFSNFATDVGAIQGATAKQIARGDGFLYPDKDFSDILFTAQEVTE